MKSIIKLLRQFDAFAFINAPSVDITSNYNGDVADVIMQAIVLGNEAVEKGSVHVEPDVTKKLSIPVLTTKEDIIAFAVETPTVAAEAFVWTEQAIDPVSMMVFDFINPRYFEQAWRPFQPVGPLVDKVDNPRIKTAILEATGGVIGKQLGKLIWQGDVTATPGPLEFFDGFVKRIGAEATSIKPTPQGPITAANVIAVLEAVEAAIPSSIWSDTDVVFHMNTTDFRLYLQAARALDFKGPNIGDAMEARFAGRQIRYYEGMAKDNVIVAKGTLGQNSNLWAGVNAENDPSNIKIERYRPESELFILKVLFSMNVNFAIGKELVIYEPA